MNKYNVFSNSKIIMWISVISILTKISVIMIFPIIEQPYCDWLTGRDETTAWSHPGVMERMSLNPRSISVG